MKNLFIFCLSLSSLCAFAQTKTAHAIKIYLEDAETGKNIRDAKVTLEGFEIQAITAKYDKKEKAYYFDEIPDGYNTVMAYHKKYNEKGFQDVQGLPKELKFRLYDPLNVSYNCETNTYKDFQQSVYVEDPYKIAVFSSEIKDYNQFYIDYIKDYNLFKDYLLKEIENLNIDIELVNPYYQKYKTKIKTYPEEKKHFEFQKEDYPYIKSFENFNWYPEILPLVGGISSDEYIGSDHHYDKKDLRVAFYLRKKDGSKFKRFNDPILKKIRSIYKISTASVVYFKYYFRTEKEGKHYKNSYTKKLDRLKYPKDIDSSKVFFLRANSCGYENRFRKYDCYGGNEILINYRENFFNQKEVNHNGDELKTSSLKKDMFDFDLGIGLGILDQYERISDYLNQKIYIR